MLRILRESWKWPSSTFQQFLALVPILWELVWNWWFLILLIFQQLFAETVIDTCPKNVGLPAYLPNWVSVIGLTLFWAIIIPLVLKNSTLTNLQFCPLRNVTSAGFCSSRPVVAIGVPMTRGSDSGLQRLFKWPMRWFV